MSWEEGPSRVGRLGWLADWEGRPWRVGIEGLVRWRAGWGKRQGGVADRVVGG